MIRRPGSHELALLQGIEVRAGRLFLELGMDAVATDPYRAIGHPHPEVAASPIDPADRETYL